jgi:molybdopterin-guanine dinucleotide biosynthesis protein A
MSAGIVLAGGRSSRMGTPKAWLDWHGTTLLRRTCGIVARGAGGPVVVVRAPGQELPELPASVRVVEDAREGKGPLQGLLAGLAAVEEDVAFLASTDMPFLHPRFVAAVCAAALDADVAVPFLGGFRQPLAAAYRTALTPVLTDLVERDRMKPAFLFELCDTRWLRELPHAESIRNLNTRADYEAAHAEPEPSVHVRCLGPLQRPAADVAAATLGAAAAAVGVTLDQDVVATLNGDQISRDPLEPLAADDEVTFNVHACPGDAELERCHERSL